MKRPTFYYGHEARRSKDAGISIRMSDQELGFIREAAKSAGMSLVDYTRLALEVVASAMDQGVPLADLRDRGIRAILEPLATARAAEDRP